MKQSIAAATLGVFLFAGGVSAEDTKDKTQAAENELAPTFLFTQTAEGVELDGETLTMSGIGPKTLYFADAPGRVVGFMPHQSFVDYWHSDVSGFLTNPPNAALVLHGEADTPTPVVELTDVALVDGNLVYKAKVLEGEAAAISGPASIVIDRGGGHHGGGGHGGGGHGGGHQERGGGAPTFQDYDWPDEYPSKPCNPHQGFFHDFFLCLK